MWNNSVYNKKIKEYNINCNRLANLLIAQEKKKE